MIKHKCSLTQENFVDKVRLKYGNDYIVLGEYINNKTKILIKHKCGEEFLVQPHRLLSTNVRCFCQGGKMFDKNKNSIAKTHPKLISIFADKDIPYNYSYGSDHKTDFICPKCGNIIKNKTIGSVISKGLSCPVCKDGFSFPEKVIFNILSQLKCNFEYHKRFEWSLRKEYDFVIFDENKIIILEVHGLQHYENYGWKKDCLKEQQLIDKTKIKLANDNNINCYIIIDARISDINFIKNSILNSQLSLLFDLNIINWEECLKNSLKSKIMEVCELWNNGITEYNDLCNLTKLSLTCVQSYLHKLSDCNLCNYKNKIKKPVRCINTNQTYESITEAVKQNPSASKNIGNCCKGKLKHCGIDSKTGEYLIWEYA